jgi:hypothetical protein
MLALSILLEDYTMSISAKSVLVFAFYLIGMGVGFVFVPNLVLGPLGFPPVSDVWSRVVGMMALLLAFYYIQAARMGLHAFFRWTVYTRVAAFIFFTGFVFAGLAGPVMILLGGVDLASALWTAWALRREQQPTTPLAANARRTTP